MKISAYHKNLGDDVEHFMPLNTYDRVYISKVFTLTPDFDTAIRADDIIRGGTGYRMTNNLPSEVESLCPDYSLYPQYKEAYGFLTRGCPRNCKFCIVGQKEGYQSKQVADISDFWRGQKVIKLLDPNLLACKDRERLLFQLIHSKAWIDFTQGLDIRLMNKDIANMIMRCKIKMIHFAWDGVKDSDLIVRKLTEFKAQTGINERKARVYVLTNFNTDFNFDLGRVYKLKELGYDPFIMIYDKYNAPKKVRQLARWVNNKYIFRSCERFEDYNPKIGSVDKAYVPDSLRNPLV